METYKNLIEKTFDFPNEEFRVDQNHLFFNNVDLQSIVEKHGTPLRLTYLPKVGEKINQAKELFENTFQKLNYQGQYIYSYCTKSNHFKFIIEETLQHGSQIETSSAFDIDIIKSLHKEGKVDEDLMIICNGFKRPQYIKNITFLFDKNLNVFVIDFGNCEF